VTAARRVAERDAIQRAALRRFGIPLVLAVVCISTTAANWDDVFGSNGPGSPECRSLVSDPNTYACLGAFHGEASELVLVVLVAAISGGAFLTAALGGLRARTICAGNRVRLRRLRAFEAGRAIRTIDAHVSAVMGFSSDSIRDIKASVRYFHRTPFMAISPRRGNEILGVVSAVPDTTGTRRAIVGIWLGPEARGHRYGAEALLLLREHLHHVGYREVGAETERTNAAMQRALESTGFSVEGKRRKILPNDREADAVMYRHVQDGTWTAPQPLAPPALRRTIARQDSWS